MTKHPVVPPPPEPPMAEKASPILVAFIYYMLRDLVPIRYIESVITHVRTHDAPLDPDLRAYAERKARELSYDPTAVGE